MGSLACQAQEAEEGLRPRRILLALAGSPAGSLVAHQVQRGLEGEEVHAADGREAALQALARGSWDLAILDTSLPWEDPDEPLRLAARLHPGLPVILLAEEADPKMVASWMRGGAVDVVFGWQKEPKTLVEAVQRTLTTSALVEESEFLASRLNRLLDQLQVGVFRSTLEGQLLEANPALLEILGFDSLEQARAERIRNHYARPEDRPLLLERLRRDSRLHEYEVEMRRRDGSHIWVSLTETLHQLPDGRMVIEGLMEDITQRKRAEAALRESEERYALAVLGAHDGIWDWNLQANQVYYSPRWKEQLGFHGELPAVPEAWLERVHPEDLPLLRSEIARHLSGLTPNFEVEHRVRHADGSWRWMLVRGVALRDDTGLPYRMAGSQSDITERKLAEEQLLQGSFHDAITGLPNRALFLDRLEQALGRAARSQDYRCAVLFLDLDRFQAINESLGHALGDKLLAEVGRRLRENLQPGDTLARLGGDEFAILLEELPDAGAAVRIAKRLGKALEVPIEMDGRQVFVTASTGIAWSGTGYLKPEDMLRDADTAVYRAKRLGRGRHEVFDAATHARALQQIELETDLRFAMERGELRLHYQPIVRLQDGLLCGFEALVRWQHPRRGLLAPAEFIPLAEENGLVVPIGRWVLREACQQMAEWRRRFPDLDMLAAAINLSGQQFAQEGLLHEIETALEETGLPPSALKIEITESQIVASPDATAKILEQIRAMGVQVSIDDFGTGYSSLSYLHRLPVRCVKIDRSFVTGLPTDQSSDGIVRAILALARTLGLQVVAEGVETTAQRDHLRSLGCDFAQGFLYSRPVPPARATELLLQRRKLDPA